MSGAAYNTGRSKQDYATPPSFMQAVVERFGQEPEWDLAALPGNAKARRYITPAEDSLSVPWPVGPLCWLNPPFNRIGPWAKKCNESGASVLFLVPASTGAEWFQQYVYDKALVLLLTPRIPFDPAKPTWGFPKDCILACYGRKPGFECWKWK